MGQACYATFWNTILKEYVSSANRFQPRGCLKKFSFGKNRMRFQPEMWTGIVEAIELCFLV